MGRYNKIKNSIEELRSQNRDLIEECNRKAKIASIIRDNDDPDHEMNRKSDVKETFTYNNDA